MDLLDAINMIRQSVQLRLKKVDADHGLPTGTLAKSIMASDGTPVTLKAPQAGGSQQRRGSFLYRSDVSESGDTQPLQQLQLQQCQQQQQQFLATPTISMRCHSNASSVSASPTMADHSIYADDQIITPFAQILQRLQIARNSYVELTKVTDRRRRRSSNYNVDPIREVNYMSAPSPNKYPEDFSLEILDDLDWCLDQLEAIQTNRSVGDLATTKFKKILTKELNQLAESSRSGSLISEYISNTFLDKEDQIESNSTVLSSTQTSSAAQTSSTSTATATTTSPLAAPTGATGARPKPDAGTRATSGASPASSRVCTMMSDIPGIRKLGELAESLKTPSRGDEELPVYGIFDVDEEVIAEQMKNINQWNFDIFKLDELTNKQSLTVMAYTVFKQRNLLATFRIPHQTMVAYLNHVQAHYDLESFYHNRMHAADVTHAVHVILNKAPQLAIFSDLEIMSVMFAAVIHDVDHPGVTNPYLINTNSDLALMYNDESILENHHLAVAFKLLQEKNCDIFMNMTARTRQRVRKMVIDMVLATDMTKHMRLLADLKTKVETKKLSGAGMLVTDNYNDRIEVMKCLLHCADLGNPTKSLDIYNLWVERVMREFFNQGDVERALGLEISPMCDRYTASVEKSQVSFIEYIVHPLWETWAELVDPYCNDILDTIEENRSYFQGLAAKNCTSPVYKHLSHQHHQPSPLHEAGDTSCKPESGSESVSSPKSDSVPETTDVFVYKRSGERSEGTEVSGDASDRNNGESSRVAAAAGSRVYKSHVTITIQKE